MKITQADTPTVQMDCHPIQTKWCPHLCHPHHFYTGCPSWYNPPNLSWLGTGTKCAALHTWWLGTFLYISPKPLKPHFDLEPDYIIRKPIKRCFQQYLVSVCTEILSTFQTRQTIRNSTHSNEWGHKCRKIPEIAPSP